MVGAPNGRPWHVVRGSHKVGQIEGRFIIHQRLVGSHHELDDFVFDDPIGCQRHAGPLPGNALSPKFGVPGEALAWAKGCSHQLRVSPILATPAMPVILCGEHLPSSTLATVDPGPVILIGPSDRVAFFSIQALRELGIRIPADIAVLGFDHSALAPLARVPLTSIGKCYLEDSASVLRHFQTFLPSKPGQDRIPEGRPRKGTAGIMRRAGG